MSHPEVHSALTPDAPEGLDSALSLWRMDAFVHSVMPKVWVRMGLVALGIAAVAERKYLPWTIAETQQMDLR